MNIDEVKNNILSDDISLKTEILKTLINNISSNYSVSISFSYEIENELKTDLYGKDYAESRKLKLLKIPLFIQYIIFN
jgi:hypothetical protein